DCRHGLAAFQRGADLLTHGHVAEARQVLLDLAQARPQSPMAALALASAQFLGRDPDAAARSLTRAAFLKPGDTALAELHHRITRLPAARGGPAAAPAVRPQVGDHLDGWRLDALLGRGGWGQVFKATRAGQARAL